LTLLRREGKHDRAGGTRGASGGYSLLAAQIACHLFGQPDERDAQRPGQGRDHFARRFLAAAFDLGKVLRRDPGPARRLGERFLLLEAEGAEPPTEHLPPQRFLRKGFLRRGFLKRRFLKRRFLKRGFLKRGFLSRRSTRRRFRLGFAPDGIDPRTLGHVFSVRAPGRRRTPVSLPAELRP
jgi:hypothetical protein